MGAFYVRCNLLQFNLLHSKTHLQIEVQFDFLSFPISGKVKGAPEDSGTAGIARECYDVTLSKYHPWLIRKGANMAMYLLPSRKTLISSMCKTSLEDAVSVDQRGLAFLKP